MTTTEIYKLHTKLFIFQIAIDDGSNSDYSDNGGAGFPVFQAAAWDRPGSSKGGPYSEGCFTEAFRSQQFGLFSIEDDGSKICFTWEGKELKFHNRDTENLHRNVNFLPF